MAQDNGIGPEPQPRSSEAGIERLPKVSDFHETHEAAEEHLSHLVDKEFDSAGSLSALRSKSSEHAPQLELTDVGVTPKGGGNPGVPSDGTTSRVPVDTTIPAAPTSHIPGDGNIPTAPVDGKLPVPLSNLGAPVEGAGPAPMNGIIPAAPVDGKLPIAVGNHGAPVEGASPAPMDGIIPAAPVDGKLPVAVGNHGAPVEGASPAPMDGIIPAAPIDRTSPGPVGSTIPFAPGDQTSPVPAGRNNIAPPVDGTSPVPVVGTNTAASADGTASGTTPSSDYLSNALAADALAYSDLASATGVTATDASLSPDSSNTIPDGEAGSDSSVDTTTSDPAITPDQAPEVIAAERATVLEAEDIAADAETEAAAAASLAAAGDTSGATETIAAAAELAQSAVAEGITTPSAAAVAVASEAVNNVSATNSGPAQNGEQVPPASGSQHGNAPRGSSNSAETSGIAPEETGRSPGAAPSETSNAPEHGNAHRATTDSPESSQEERLGQNRPEDREGHNRNGAPTGEAPVKPESKPESKPEAKPEPKPEAKPEPKPEATDPPKQSANHDQGHNSRSPEPRNEQGHTPAPQPGSPAQGNGEQDPAKLKDNKPEEKAAAPAHPNGTTPTPQEFEHKKENASSGSPTPDAPHTPPGPTGVVPPVTPQTDSHTPRQAPGQGDNPVPQPTPDPVRNGSTPEQDHKKAEDKVFQQPAPVTPPADNRGGAPTGDTSPTRPSLTHPVSGGGGTGGTEPVGVIPPLAAPIPQNDKQIIPTVVPSNGDPAPLPHNDAVPPPSLQIPALNPPTFPVNKDVVNGGGGTPADQGRIPSLVVPAPITGPVTFNSPAPMDLPTHVAALPAPLVTQFPSPYPIAEQPKVIDANNPGIYLSRAVQTLPDVLPTALSPAPGLDHIHATNPADNPFGPQSINPSLNINIDAPRNRDLDRLLSPNRQRDDLQQWMYLVIPPSQHDTPTDSAKPVATAPTTVAKFEMQAQSPQQPADDAAKHSKHHDSLSDSAVQNLVQLLSDLKPMRLLDSVVVNNVPPTQVANLPAPANQQPVSVSPVIRQDQPLLPALVGRIADVTVDLRQPGRLVFDPNSPVLSLARQQILAEATSLKDLINTNRNITEPMRLTDMQNLIGLKGDLLSGTPRSLQDPLSIVRGVTGLEPQAKIDPLLVGKGLDGKIDPTLIGVKPGELIPDGSKIGGKDPLDSLSGDKSLLGDRKDIIDKKDDKDKADDNKNDKDLISILAATHKVKEQKPEIKEEEKVKDEKKNEQEVRRKYIVRQGDTLESIAIKILEDARYSLLLEMINRGYIRYQWEGAVRKALLKVGQVIWLPTTKEVQVHQALFFTRKDKQKSRLFDGGAEKPGAAAVSSETETEDISQALPDIEVVDGDTVVIAKQEEAPGAQDQVAGSDTVVIAKSPAVTGDSQSAFDSANSAVATDNSSTVILQTITRPLQNSPAPDFVAPQIAAGSHSRIKLSIAPSPVAHAPFAKESPASNKSEQSWSEIQDLLNRMRMAAETGRMPKESLSSGANTVSLDLPLVGENDNDKILKQLDSHNRIMMESADEEGAFFLRQEKQVMGEWKTIAYYEFSEGRSVRYLNKSNGARRAFHVNLPQSIVKEMAVKDFSNNWKTYASDYDLVDLRSRRPSPHAC